MIQKQNKKRMTIIENKKRFCIKKFKADVEKDRNLPHKECKRFTMEDYKKKFLILERLLMMKALKKARGNCSKAHKLNCPESPVPYYSYDSYIKRLAKHNLDWREFQTEC